MCLCDCLHIRGQTGFYDQIDRYEASAVTCYGIQDGKMEAEVGVLRGGLRQIARAFGGGAGLYGDAFFEIIG